MKFNTSFKCILLSILSGNYTNSDLKNFVKFCYAFAFPLVSKKLSLGKLNLKLLGMSQNEIVFDCMADIFSRDNEDKFYKIKTYFENLNNLPESLSEEEIIIVFRRFLFNVVNNNIIRLYFETDPVLGKILRNMKIALKRDTSFTQLARFSDVYLVPDGIDVLWNKPPYIFERLQNDFSKIVLIDDTIPEMIKKLYDFIVNQEEYQRAVPFVSAAILFKEVYVLGWKSEVREITNNMSITDLDNEDIKAIVKKVCTKIKNCTYHTYVDKGKVTELLFLKYIDTLNDILINSFSTIEMITDSYFENLKTRIPELTKDAYIKGHKKIIEYLAKMGKEEMKNELQKL